MRLPEWTKPAIWGAIVGGIATAIVGFSYLGWTTGGSAEKMAQAQSEAAVVSALVPFCATKAQQDADVTKLAKFRAETSSYGRTDIVSAAGWATMPGMTGADNDLARACAEKLQLVVRN
jgi:ABC-type amino acid transport substrate-binding protein